jgi:hypothetical protein
MFYIRNWLARRKGIRRARPPCQPHYRPGLEALDDRIMLNGSPIGYDAATQALILRGDQDPASLNNVFALQRQGADLVATVDGTQARIAVARVKSIYVHAGDGHDVLHESNLRSAIAVTYEGGKGEDMLSYASYDGGGVVLNLPLGSGTGLARITNVENAIGSQQGDVLIGIQGIGLLAGLGGSDLMLNGKYSFGGAGNDVLYARTGVTQVDPGRGDDIVLTDVDLVAFLKSGAQGVALPSAHDAAEDGEDKYVLTSRLGPLEDVLRSGLGAVQTVTQRFQPAISQLRKPLPGFSHLTYVDLGGPRFAAWVSFLDNLNRISIGDLSGSFRIGTYEVSAAGIRILERVDPYRVPVLGATLNRLRDVGLTFPILEGTAPFRAFVLGQKDVEVFRFDLLDLSVSFVRGMSFTHWIGPVPVCGNLWVSGAIRADLRLSCDLHGIATTGRLHDGILVAAEISLTTSLGGEALAGPWFLRAGISGAISGTVSLGTGPTPLRWQQLVSQGLTPSGRIDYHLDLVGQMLWRRFYITIASGSIYLG